MVVYAGGTPASDLLVDHPILKKGNRGRLASFEGATMLEVMNGIVTGTLDHDLARDFAQGDDESRQRVLQKVVDAYRQGARARLVEENPDFFTPGTGE